MLYRWNLLAGTPLERRWNAAGTTRTTGTTAEPKQYDKMHRMQSIMYYIMLYMYRTTRAATTVLVVTSTTVLVVAYW